MKLWYVIAWNVSLVLLRRCSQLMIPSRGQLLDRAGAPAIFMISGVGPPSEHRADRRRTQQRRQQTSNRGSGIGDWI